jgi:hypothetical protein
MSVLTVYIDDSAEERRRKRRRWIEIAILIAIFVSMQSLSRVIVMTKTITTAGRDTEATETIFVDRYRSLDTQDVPPPPRLAVEPRVLDFGTRGAGSGSPAQLVSIRNAGGHSLRVSLRSTGGAFAVASNCAGTVPCAAAVVFAPAVAGRHDGELLVSGGGQTRVVRLSGFATAVTPRLMAKALSWPDLTVTTTNGTNGTSTTKRTTAGVSGCAPHIGVAIEPASIHFFGGGRRTVTLSNPHACPVSVDAITIVNADRPDRAAGGYQLTGVDGCKKILRPGESCSFVVGTAVWLRYTRHARVHVKSALAP